MTFKSTLIPVAALLLLSSTAGSACRAPAKTPVATTSAAKRDTPAVKGKSRADRVADSYNSHSKLRAAKALQEVRWKGNYESNHSYIEFSSESNFIYIKFDGDYRQGKITSPGRTRPDAREGEYSILTWKPQNYVGHRTGPSRAYFKSFLLKWKIRDVKSDAFTGRVLHLRVFGSRRLSEGVKEIHNFKLRAKPHY